ncbi:MFS transporter [Sphingobium sp. Leaf26]|uniref:MFS transporter n=1 Tax=Sphingobium sp. Leaf26 TaxID=1735693 RepID=UPI0006F83587|nr:MFS transporter [Sphingobium sp. Leaf26]KQN08077.1 MFS transporter [Sphingobium sp. Leaf26]
MSRLVSFFRRLTLVPQGITIVTAAFLPIFAIVSMFPAVPAIIDHFAADPDARWKVPMMVSAPGLTIALIAPFAGWFVDRIGRRPLLIGATLLYGIFGTAPFFLDSLNAVFASRLLLGVAEAAILTIVNTLIGDYWEDEGRRDWLMLQGVAGPFLASGVIALSGPATAMRWNGIFLVYLIAFPIFFAMMAWLFEPKRQAHDMVDATDASRAAPSAGTLFPWMPVGLLGLVTLCASCLYYVFIINGGLAFREVGVTDPSALSAMTALPSLSVIVGALVFRALGGKANAVQLSAFFLMLGLGLLGIGMATSAKWMIAALVVQQTGAGMAVPSLIAWAQTKLPFQHRGRGMGIWTACFFFGQFSSPFLVHKLNDATGTMQGAFMASGLIGLVLAIIIFLFLDRSVRGAPGKLETA